MEQEVRVSNTSEDGCHCHCSTAYMQVLSLSAHLACVSLAESAAPPIRGASQPERASLQELARSLPRARCVPTLAGSQSPASALPPPFALELPFLSPGVAHPVEAIVQHQDAIVSLILVRLSLATCIDRSALITRPSVHLGAMVALSDLLP